MLNDFENADYKLISSKGGLSEEEKLEIVVSRFENIDKDDLMDGEAFWKWLDEQPL